jgi:RNA polymerase sigma factor (sigma-70 family)
MPTVYTPEIRDAEPFVKARLKKLINRYRIRCPFTRDAMEIRGIEAWLWCKDRYTPERGRFEHYASKRVTGAMIDHLREHGRLKRSLCRRKLKLVSLEAVTLAEDGSRFEYLEAKESVWDEVKLLRWWNEWGWARKLLTMRERVILFLRFVEEWDMAEIGEAVGLSESGVSLRIAQAKLDVRARIEMEELRERIESN